MGWFDKKKKDEKKPNVPGGKPAVPGAPAANSPSTAAPAVDMFSTLSTAPSASDDMFGGLSTAPAAPMAPMAPMAPTSAAPSLPTQGPATISSLHGPHSGPRTSLNGPNAGPMGPNAGPRGPMGPMGPMAGPNAGPRGPMAGPMAGPMGPNAGPRGPLSVAPPNVPSVPSAPTGPSTPSNASNDPLLAAKQKVMQVCNQLRSEIIRFNEAEKKMDEIVKGYENEIVSIQAKVVEGEALVHGAIAAEDYAKADQINATIEKLKEDISNKENDIRQSVLRASQAQQIKSNKVQTEIISLESVYKTYGIYFKQLESQTNSILESLNKKDQENEGRLVGMQQQLQARMDTYEAQRSIISDEREKVESLVRVDSADIIVEMDTNKEQKNTLENEIADLEAQIKAKQQELLGVNKKISDNEAQIEVVRQRYRPDFAPIEAKEKNLLSEQQTIDGMKSAYQNAQSFVEKSKQENDSQRQQKHDQIKSIKSEMESITYLGEALKSCLQKSMETMIDISSQQNMVYTLKQTVDSSESQLQGVLTRMKTLDNIIEECNKKIVGFDGQLPALDQEKQKAIAQKNFKQAGVYSQQMKSISTMKEQAEGTKGQAEAERSALDASSGSQVNELQQKKDAYNEALKVLDFRQLDVQQYCARIYRRALRHIKKNCDETDPYFIALIALLEANFNLCMEELNAISSRRNVEALGEETDSDEETVVDIAIEPTVLQPVVSAPVVEQSLDMFDSMETLPMSSTVEESNQDVSEVNELDKNQEDVTITIEVAQNYLSIAKVKFDEISSDLESATNEERWDDCDTLYNEQSAVDEYIQSLNAFIAAGVTSVPPPVPECIANYIVSADKISGRRSSISRKASVTSVEEHPVAETIPEVPSTESAPVTDMGSMFADMAPLAPQTPSGLDAMVDLASETEDTEPVVAETSTVPAPADNMFNMSSAAPADNMFNMTAAPADNMFDMSSSAPADNMFNMSSSAPADNMFNMTAAPAAPAPAPSTSSGATITPEEAQRLYAIADSLYQKKQNDMDDALNNDQMDNFETLEQEANALESYKTALAAVTSVSAAPVAPSCFDPNFSASQSAPSNNGGDMFSGMADNNGGDMFSSMSNAGGDMFSGMSNAGGDMFSGMSNNNGGDMFSGF